MVTLFVKWERKINKIAQKTVVHFTIDQGVHHYHVVLNLTPVVMSLVAVSLMVPDNVVGTKTKKQS